MINSYRDLLVWQKSMQLVTQVYQSTQLLPKEELYGLTAQIRRCAVSVPGNIAEGYGRNSTNDYLHFLQIACGSLYELQTQLELCLNLAFFSKDHFENIYNQTQEIEKMLVSLVKKVGANR